MNLFFSGIGKNVIEQDERLGSPRYRLFSCHSQYFKYAWNTSALMPTIDNEFEILYDSGAFTAWTKGEEVNLVTLGDTYERLFDQYGHTGRGVYFINLDKIPGAPGRTASLEEIEECLKVSDDNFNYLRNRLGDIIIPVFHQNESEERLHVVAAAAPYICISPRNDVAEKSRVSWAAEVHSKLPPGLKTHGLATTGHPMMTRVPWHSVDSATWIMIAAYGHVYVNHRLQFCSVSSDSPNKQSLGHHYDNLSKQEQDNFHVKMDGYGFELEELQRDFVTRAIWNRLVMSEIQRDVSSRPITAPVQAGLFKL